MNKVLGLIGKYELQRPLERGSLAEVWKAFDTRLKRSVALMLLHPDLQVNPDFITQPCVMPGYYQGRTTGPPSTEITCASMPHLAAHCRCRTGGSHEVRVKLSAVKCGQAFSRSLLVRPAPSLWYGWSLVQQRRAQVVGITSIRFSARQVLSGCCTCR
jgi:serine/threonine protein kinase